MKCFFVPGRKWMLSQAEIRSVLNSSEIKYVELAHNENIFLYDLQIEQSVLPELFQKLGGFIRGGEVIEDPYQYLDETYKATEDSVKVPFSVSIFGATSSKKAISDEKFRLGMELKKWLKERRYSPRFVAKRSSAETSVVLMDTNSVLDKGFELCAFNHPKNKSRLWGVTNAVQDYKGFAERDYQRPQANKKKGMVPPKLSRIMVNLAQQPEGSIIWDPFCGSGTILMEAVLRGYQVLGTDIDEQSVKETTENLKWLCDKYWISHQKYLILQHDIRDGLPHGITRADAIVTEPYLGPVLRSTTSVERVDKITEDIKPLYSALFTAAAQVKKNVKSGKIVIVIPGFKTDSGWVDMDVTNGDLPFHDETEKLSSYPLQWDRPHSIIRRNIKIFSY